MPYAMPLKWNTPSCLSQKTKQDVVVICNECPPIGYTYKKEFFGKVNILK